MSMSDFFEKLSLLAFEAHDRLLTFLARWSRPVKLFILIVAHMSLLGIFFPELRRDYGSLAGNALILILFLSPVAAVTRMPLLRIVMGFRREMGILMAYLAIVHGAGYFLDPTYFDTLLLPYLGSDFLSMDPQLIFGIVALILTFPLLLTSNAFSLKRLGGLKWKRLHFLVYPMFVFVAVHRFFRGGDAGLFAGIFETSLLLGSYAFLKYLAWRPGSAPILRRVIDDVGRRYRESVSVRRKAS